jgi:hypothetical protein
MVAAKRADASMYRALVARENPAFSRAGTFNIKQSVAFRNNVTRGLAPTVAVALACASTGSSSSSSDEELAMPLPTAADMERTLQSFSHVAKIEQVQHLLVQQRQQQAALRQKREQQSASCEATTTRATPSPSTPPAPAPTTSAPAASGSVSEQQQAVAGQGQAAGASQQSPNARVALGAAVESCSRRRRGSRGGVERLVGAGRQVGALAAWI